MLELLDVDGRRLTLLEGDGAQVRISILTWCYNIDMLSCAIEVKVLADSSNCGSGVITLDIRWCWCGFLLLAEQIAHFFKKIN